MQRMMIGRTILIRSRNELLSINVVNGVFRELRPDMEQQRENLQCPVRQIPDDGNHTREEILYPSTMHHDGSKIFK